jgi:hypothetical protein
MSLNKFTNSTDYLNKQYLNIGCNDIKCSSLEINNTPVGLSFEYSPIPYALSPSDAVFENVNVLYNTVGNHMNLDFLIFTVNLPTNTQLLVFSIPLPSGYTGTGAGDFVSIVANAVNSSGNEFHPYVASFTPDNQGIEMNFLSANNLQGTFIISIQISCKVVKQ